MKERGLCSSDAGDVCDDDDDDDDDDDVDDDADAEGRAGRVAEGGA